jgi:hypothetical protein
LLKGEKKEAKEGNLFPFIISFFIIGISTSNLWKCPKMADASLPPPSKNRLKRLAAKQLRKDAKRAKSAELISKPGPPTISDSELDETTSYIKDGMFILHIVQPNSEF